MGISRNKRREVIRLKQQTGQIDLMKPRKHRRKEVNRNERKVIQNR